MPTADRQDGCVYEPNDTKWLTAILGWLVTALAVMLGAPFWFDVLNKFMVVRSTVKPREKSPDEASEDRQDAHAGKGAPATTATRTPAKPLSTDVPDRDPGQSEIAAALGLAALATAQGIFEPHAWATGNPQGGLL